MTDTILAFNLCGFRRPVDAGHAHTLVETAGRRALIDAQSNEIRVGA